MKILVKTQIYAILSCHSLKVEYIHTPCQKVLAKKENEELCGASVSKQSTSALNCFLAKVLPVKYQMTAHRPIIHGIYLKGHYCLQIYNLAILANSSFSLKIVLSKFIAT